MNNKADIILSYDYDTVKEIADDVWHDEQPADSDECTHEWECKFKQILANSIRSHYELEFNLESLHPLIGMLVGFDDINWNHISNTVFDDYVESLIADFVTESEERRKEEMSEAELKDYYDELRGDQQYDSYIDDLINGY